MYEGWSLLCNHVDGCMRDGAYSITTSTDVRGMELTLLPCQLMYEGWSLLCNHVNWCTSDWAYSVSMSTDVWGMELTLSRTLVLHLIATWPWKPRSPIWYSLLTLNCVALFTSVIFCPQMPQRLLFLPLVFQVLIIATLSFTGCPQ